jgi:hypothetical protein
VADDSTVFYLDHDWDWEYAPNGHSRYAAYLDQAHRNFDTIHYDDPTVAFAVEAWRVAIEPVMSPPFAHSPKQVMSAWVERNDWDGQAVLNVGLRTARPPWWAYAKTADGRYYRDWATTFSGDYEGISGQDLATSPYLLCSAQLLIQLKPGTLNRLDQVPPRGHGRYLAALDCLDGLVAVFNREVGPLLDAGR